MDMNEEELDIKYIPIAIITTSLARTYLLNAIYENIENVYYCDTDSMFVNGNAKGIEEDEYKLGA
ncbi:MAG: hypothetical protein HUJ61_04945 [Bacilli bacterium]|nr:hypothetical protein [Bacilli bacterium]